MHFIPIFCDLVIIEVRSSFCIVYNQYSSFLQGSWSRPSNSHSAVEKALATEGKLGDWEIDRRLLKLGEKIASGSSGDL